MGQRTSRSGGVKYFLAQPEGDALDSLWGAVMESKANGWDVGFRIGIWATPQPFPPDNSNTRKPTDFVPFVAVDNVPETCRVGAARTAVDACRTQTPALGTDVPTCRSRSALDFRRCVNECRGGFVLSLARLRPAICSNVKCQSIKPTAGRPPPPFNRHLHTTLPPPHLPRPPPPIHRKPQASRNRLLPLIPPDQPPTLGRLGIRGGNHRRRRPTPSRPGNRPALSKRNHV